MTKISDRKVPNMLAGFAQPGYYGLPEEIKNLPHMQMIIPGKAFSFAQMAQDLRLLYLNADRDEPKYRQDPIIVRHVLETLEATAYELWIAKKQLDILSVL